MAANVNVAEPLSLMISLVGLWALWFYGFQPYFVDRFRQDLFALRDHLFDGVGRESGLFDHEAYVLMEGLINQLIRFGHRTEAWTFFITRIRYNQHSLLKDREPSFSKAWRSALEKLPPDERRELDRIYYRVCSLVFQRLVFSSLILLTGALVSAILSLFGQGFAVTMEKIGGWIVDRLENDAAPLFDSPHDPRRIKATP
ncbi:MAG: hypothetical protein HQL51_05585 [Magnetococcales bacterium]|nr:hypothetical protein [Magnetococcales bacterium]